MTRIAFMDTETTGLDPDQHEIWEVALIMREPAVKEGDTYVLQDAGWNEVGRYRDPDVELGARDTEYVWQLPVDLGRADQRALDVGRFHERYTLVANGHPGITRDGVSVEPISAADERAQLLEAFAAQFSRLTWGAHLVGAVPSFDEERLRRLLRRYGACPGWHYHLIDVEALAVGYLSGDEARARDEGLRGAGHGTFRLPWKSEDLSRCIGVDPDEFEKHTALGDARWARAIYDKVMETS